jgi:drug/metabolite transporter (DMT)-like permease
MSVTTRKESPARIIIAFATIYLVWGSTYFFIQKAIEHIPSMMMGALRFLAAGIILMIWCLIRGEHIGTWHQIKPAIISGLMLLLLGTGAVILAEKTLPSSLVAVLVSSSPVWFIILDKSKWKENFSTRSTVIGLISGFIGVILLFSEKAIEAISSNGNKNEIIGFIILTIGTISWAGGSLYSKHHSSKSSSSISSAWQMLAAGVAFELFSVLGGEWKGFEWQSVTMGSWLSVLYLIFFGSLAGYSAYVWLLKVRPAIQVSTHAYINPVIAILLGVFFANEHMSLLQLSGFVVILGSVLLINLTKYRNEQKLMKMEKTPLISKQ